METVCNYRSLAFTMGCFILAITFGCSREEYRALTSEQVRAMLDEELRVGDPKSSIEAFGEKHGFNIVYFELGEYYTSGVRVGSHHWVEFDIYVDEDHNILKWEVVDSYLGL